MTTQSYLGKLKKLTLWMDNKGSSPDWMVSKILIVDLKTDEKYAFIRQENNILKIYLLFFLTFITQQDRMVDVPKKN